MKRTAKKDKLRRHLNLDQLESFVALADCKGVTAAAKRLERAQPTVSQHIQRLEAQLERTLVLRSRTGTTLTSDGTRLLPLARGLLRLNEQFSTRQEHPPVRLGACSNIGVYLLPQLLIDFRGSGETLPHVCIANNPEVVRQLMAAELDIALVEWWDERPGFESRVWRHEPVVAVLPGDHPLTAHHRISLDQLRRVPILGGEPGTGTGRLLRTYMRKGKPIEVAMSLGSTEAVKRAVSAGLGASLVLQLSVAEFATGKLAPVAVRPLTPALRKPLHLVWRAELSINNPLLTYLASTIAEH